MQTSVPRVPRQSSSRPRYFAPRSARTALVVAAALVTVGAFAMGKAPHPQPLPTVASVDLGRYLGRWYEIARLPQSFEKGCAGVTADYASRPDQKVDVVNTCHKGGVDGEVSTAHGVARVIDPQTNAKLKVSFFWPFEGDYWILELGQDYEYAVVGSPDRDSLWFLSRTPQIDRAIVDAALARRAEQGFDISRIEWTEQAPAN